MSTIPLMQKWLWLFIVLTQLAGNIAFAAGMAAPMGQVSTMKTVTTMDPATTVDHTNNSQMKMAASAVHDAEHDCCDGQPATPDIVQERCCDGSCDNCEPNFSGASAVMTHISNDAPASADPAVDGAVQPPLTRPTQVDHPPIR